MYLAPSGVQKERILPEHMFVLPFAQSAVPKPGSKRDLLRIPSKKGLNESQCTPLFWNAFTMRDAQSCIHTHSQNAGASSLLPSYLPQRLPSDEALLLRLHKLTPQSCSRSCSARTRRASASRTRR